MRNTQTDRQTDRHTVRNTQTDRQTDRQWETHTHRPTDTWVVSSLVHYWLGGRWCEDADETVALRCDTVSGCGRCSQTADTCWHRHTAVTGNCHVVQTLHGVQMTQLLSTDKSPQYWQRPAAPPLPQQARIQLPAYAENVALPTSTIRERYDTRCYFNEQSEADMSRIDRQHRTNK